MSQHASLRVDSVGSKHRNVLTRLERIKKLQAQGKWKDRKTAFGLPKVKSMKIKVKKSVDEPAKEGAEAATAQPGATPAVKAAAKAEAKPKK